MGKCISKEFHQPLHIRELAESTYIATDDEFHYYYDDEVGFLFLPPIFDLIFTDFYSIRNFLERFRYKVTMKSIFWHLQEKFFFSDL